MKRFNRVNRFHFVWIAIFLAAGLPLLFLVFSAIFPELMRYREIFNSACVVCLAVFCGARFVDAGYPRWIGTTLLFLIAVGVPLGFVFIGAPILKIPSNQLEHYSNSVVGGVLVVTVCFLVVTAMLPTVDDDNEGDLLPADDYRSERREPRF